MRAPTLDGGSGVRASTPAARALPFTVMAAVALVVAVGLTLTAVLEPRAFGSWLGAPLPPLFAFWSPTFGAWSVAAVAAVAAAVLAAPRLASGRLGALVFAGAAFVLGLGLRLASSAARDGPAAWAAPFGDEPRAGTEYLPALPGIEGLGAVAYLDRFAAIMPTLPVHASAHPPGTIVLLHLLGIDTATAMAALTIVVGALAVPLTYALGRTVLGERHARVAALLLAFCPAALLYGATSVDAMFATLALVAAVPLASRARLARPLGAAALALASLFSWALLAIGAWATLLAWLRWGLGPAVRVALWSGAAVVAANALLYATIGYDPIAALDTAGHLYGIGVSGVRPYWYWVLGSPAAFAIAIGLPLTWLVARAAALRHSPALALVALVATAALLGFSKAETERIWLFMAPLACIAAAPLLGENRLRLVIALLAAQALATELLFYTLW